MTSNIHAITLPKMGLTMEEGSVAAWHIDLGDTIKDGDEIADIETEKITVAYESPVTGVWRRTIATVGEDLPVGALIGVVAEDNVEDAEIDTFVSNFKPQSET